MSHHRNYDLAIVGAGPAGLALAAEAVGLGASVAVIDPAPETVWKTTWCGFPGDLPEDVPVARRWGDAMVRLDDRVISDARGYVQVDGPALQARLRERCRAASFVVGAAEARTRTGLRIAGGRELRAAAVVDCSGPARVLGGSGRATAFQTAWGLEIETDGHPWRTDTAMWMDLTDLQDPPSFLYALPHDDRTVFVEETALAARPAVPLALLERRLSERLDRLGVKVREVRAVERCAIPLDLPPADGLAFGTAAGMVHPATGYVLARVLGGARGFATAIAEGRAEAEMRRLRGARARDLHLLGLDVLVGSDGPALARFFDAFFALPPSARDSFLSTRPHLLGTGLAMARMFLAAPASLKRQLAAPLFVSREPLPEVACPHS